MRRYSDSAAASEACLRLLRLVDSRSAMYWDRSASDSRGTGTVSWNSFCTNRDPIDAPGSLTAVAQVRNLVAELAPIHPPAPCTRQVKIGTGLRASNTPTPAR